jgi:hypothetical protein
LSAKLVEPVKTETLTASQIGFVDTIFDSIRQWPGYAMQLGLESAKGEFLSSNSSIKTNKFD